MENLKIGFSEKSLVPEGRKISLAGQLYERVSEYVETPITATAMAVEANGEQAVFCSCDLIGAYPFMIRNAKKLIREKIPDFNTDKLVVSATHTHTSYVYRARGVDAISVVNRYIPEKKKDKVTYPPEWISPEDAGDLIAERVAEAVCEAWQKREPALYANEFGRAVVGHNRRVVYDDKKAKMYGDTYTPNFYMLEEGSDSGVEMLYIFSPEKKLRGVVLNVPCPSQILEHCKFISSDYWGKTRILLREKYGENLYVLGLCGAGGDQSPRDLIRWKEPKTVDDPHIIREVVVERKADPSMFEIEGTWEIGKRLARVVDEKYDLALGEARDIEFFGHYSIQMDYAFRKVTISDYNTARAFIDNYIANMKNEHVDRHDVAALYLSCGTLARYELQQKTPMRTAEVHVVRFGNIAVVTSPFELYQNFMFRIRAMSPALQTFCIQLACDAAGYLPTKEAEDGGHYSAYVTSGTAGHETGNMLVHKTVSLLNSLWKN